MRKGLIEKFYEAASIQRWNDHVRPFELTELDKQAHKMIVAWLLYKLNESRLSGPEERLLLAHNVIKGGIFDYFFRLVVTDIKPPVFYRIKDNPSHFAKLAEWALKELAPQVKPLGDDFWREFSAYVRGERSDALATRILDAAHHYASWWEFRVIRPFNGFDDEMPEIDKSFIAHLERNRDLAGVPELLGENPEAAIHKLAKISSSSSDACRR